MRTWTAGLLMLVLIIGSAFATPSPVVDNTPQQPIAGDPPADRPGVDRPGSVGHGIVAVMGDTLIVDMSWRDMMHNATVPRMITVSDPDGGGTYEVYLVYTGRTSPTASSQATVVRVDVAPNGTMTIDPSTPVLVQSFDWAAYNQVFQSSTVYGEGSDIHLYHSGNANNDYTSRIAIPNQFIPWFYNTWTMPEVAVQTMWPFGEFTPYGATGYIHSIVNEYDPDNNFEDGIYYNRAEFDEVTWQVSNATPGGDNQTQITDVAMNLSGSVAVNGDGSRVALAQTLYREGTVGEVWLSGDTQYNNDLWLWESTDGGDTWSFDLGTATDVTHFIPADADLLPDTTAANQDTFRVYTETEIIYDGNNTLHAAFGVNVVKFFDQQVYRYNRLFYWNDNHQMFTQIADGTFWNFATTPTWESQVCNAQLYKDPDTGILWCAWVQFGEPGDYIGTTPIDASDDGIKAADIYVSASPNNGLHWAKGVNITNTRNPGTQLTPYETMSERELSLAHNSDGDYLHLTYLIDYDPGIAVPGGTAPEGEPTENDIVYHRVSKQELIDQFEANGEWVHNYPLHVDSTGFFQSTDDWEWNGFFNPDGGQPQYGELDLQGINTVVGPGGGTIAYSAHLETYVNQSFQDVDYWVTVTFPSGQEFGPFNQQTYNIPALANITIPYIEQQIPGGIPAGQYTYTAHLGMYPVSILDDSFTFTKLGANTEDAGTFDPTAWPADQWPEATGDAESIAAAQAVGFEMHDAWPNPFNDAARFAFTLPVADRVTVTVHDVLGRQVMTLANGRMTQGRHEFSIDGSALSSGVYFLTVMTRSQGQAVSKIALVK